MNLPAALKSLSFLTGFVRRFGSLGPISGLVAPMLGAAADLIADAIRAFFNGLAIAFRNPTVLAVIFVAMGYGYFHGHASNAAEVKRLTAEVSRLQKIKGRAPSNVKTSPPSIWDSIFK